jgi:hypothetical protein
MMTSSEAFCRLDLLVLNEKTPHDRMDIMGYLCRLLNQDQLDQIEKDINDVYDHMRKEGLM